MRASEFGGVKRGKKQKEKGNFVDTPCLVFAPKEKDRQGCALPASSLHLAGIIMGQKVELEKIDIAILRYRLSPSGNARQSMQTP
jgi:hypothetical protein